MSTYLPVAVLAIAALVVVYARWKKKEQDELYRLLQRQGVKRGGQTKPGTLLYYPKLIFADGGAEFTASALLGHPRPDRRSSTTYVAFPLELPPGNDFSIRKKTKSLQTLVDSHIGGASIWTGNRAFDETFLVKGENARTLLGFLTDEMQRELLAFDERVDVRCSGNQCSVTVDEIVKTETTLHRMLELAVLANDALSNLATESNGV